MFPEGYEARIVEIGHLPLYNFDYDDPAETDFPTPESYTAFRETIKASDGVLFVTAENNRTVPACLKNAVDIGSKPNADVAWKNTPGRHHQPFRRQNGRLQLAEKPTPGLVLFQYAADRPTRSLPRQLAYPCLTTTTTSSNRHAASCKATSTNWSP